MQLRELTISLQQWGADEGKYQVTVEYLHDKSELKLVLPPELSNALLAVVADHILKASSVAAAQLSTSIGAAILQPPIEAKQLY